MQQIMAIKRPTDIPDVGMLCDFLWSDPDSDIQGWGENDRGVSYTYGTDVVSDFLAKFDFDLVVRAHQVVENGYEFFGKRQLVTVFSAPNYCAPPLRRQYAHAGRASLRLCPWSGPPAHFTASRCAESPHFLTSLPAFTRALLLLPRPSGGEFDNAGAMMTVDENLMCSFQILKPAEKKLSGFGGLAGAQMEYAASGTAHSPVSSLYS